MNLAPNITAISIPLKFSTTSSSCFLPTTPKPLRTCTTPTPSRFQISNSVRVPARDRVIDLGKYKGKMLGSLPSNYLKWVSKNLRAGETEEWAKLADEVLRDPIYRDRMEWELAEKILNGNGVSPNLRMRGNAVSELVEISERFGWDNEDKEGWSKIDFGLLGTSKGGRIPRGGGGGGEGRKCISEVGNVKKKEEKMGVEGERRRERRERMRERRKGVVEVERGGRRRVEENNMNGEEREDGGRVGSPFPGREALVRKALLNQR